MLRYPRYMEARVQLRDGRHDFDFLFGNWNVRNRRLTAPLSGAQEWYEFDGTSVARPLWSGKGNMDEFSAQSPLGHLEGFTLRCYDVESARWSLYWATPGSGLGTLPNVGSFGDDGIGDFFCEEVIGGKSIVSRYRWTKDYRNGCRWEQAFSADAGTTWETNWTMDFTRR